MVQHERERHKRQDRPTVTAPRLHLRLLLLIITTPAAAAVAATAVGAGAGARTGINGGVGGAGCAVVGASEAEEALPQRKEHRNRGVPREKRHEPSPSKRPTNKEVD